MKKLKLFPKTFLYVFSLMAVISLISHALFYFMMPIVYASQKEAKFLDTQAQLIEVLKNTSTAKMESVVSRYALQYQMGIFANCDVTGRRSIIAIIMKNPIYSILYLFYRFKCLSL